MNVKRKKPMYITCLAASAAGTILSFSGIIVTTILGAIHVMRGSFANVFGLAFSFLFLLIGAPILGYEGSGTPLNVAINTWFYVFLVCYYIFTALIVFTAIKFATYKYAEKGAKAE